jgi:hypothetical protein
MYVTYIRSKYCVNYTELGNGAMLTTRGCHGDVFTAHGGEKKLVDSLRRL